MAKISVPDDQQQCSSDGDFDPHVASLAHWAFLISFVVPFTALIIPLVLYNTTGKDGYTLPIPSDLSNSAVVRMKYSN